MKKPINDLFRSARLLIAATVLVLSITAGSAYAQCLTPCTGGVPTPVAAISQPKPEPVPTFTLIELLVVISIIGILLG